MSIITIYLIFSMLAVMWFDATRYLIPNWLNGSLLILYPLAVWLSPHPVDWLMALAGMLVVLALGYGVFSMKWMGGGDIKLLTVCSLWVGWQHLLEFVLYVALLGGVLSVVLLLLRQALPFVPVLAGKNTPRLLQPGAPVPYGLAIAVGFLIMINKGIILAAA